MIETLRKMVAPLATRIANTVARAVVKNVDDTQKVQLLQLAILDGETRDDVELFGQYGFTSNPPDDSEAVILCVGGRRDHPLAIGVENRQYRIKNLGRGEVAVYNDTGATIVFKANGDIEVTPKSGQKLRLAGDMVVTGNVDASGTITGTTDVVGGGKSLKTHTHSVAGSVAAAPGPVVFVPPALTGAPV